MRVSLAWLNTALVIGFAAWAIWLLLLWQPARQVELHTLNLLARASARDWPAVEAMMAANYRDAWNDDRASAIDDARQLFSHFFALQIVPLSPLRVADAGDARTASAPIGIFGSGTAVAHAVIEEGRSAQGDAVFVWRKAGGWPWQWELTEVRHDALPARRLR